MAKRKPKSKEVTVEIPVKEETPSVAYRGTVKVSLVKNNKIYSTKTFKNTGCWSLFYFLCGCLAGQYGEYESYRPRFIRLFNAGEKGNDEPSITTLNDFNNVFDAAKLHAAMAYPYSADPDINLEKGTDSNVQGDSSITYKFMIPFTQINTTDAINLIALYSTTHIATDNSKYPSAYLFITEQDPQTGQLKLSDLIDDNVKDDSTYNLYIEWTLSLKSK